MNSFFEQNCGSSAPDVGAGGKARRGDAVPVPPETEVLRRSDTSSARRIVFVVRLSCGHERTITGERLRQLSEIKRVPICRECEMAGRGAGTRAQRRNRERNKTHGRGYGRGWCALCAGLPHRVEGERCRRCNLEFSELAEQRADGEARKGQVWL